MRKRLIRLLPWLVTAGCWRGCFHKIELDKFKAGIHNAAGWMAPPPSAASCWSTSPTRSPSGRRSVVPDAHVGSPTLLLVRGATYLLAAINYNVGQGAIVYFVHRTVRDHDHAADPTTAAGPGHQRPGAAVPRNWRPRRRTRRSRTP
jgi:hypothetical protein